MRGGGSRRDTGARGDVWLKGGIDESVIWILWEMGGAKTDSSNLNSLKLSERWFSELFTKTGSDQNNYRYLPILALSSLELLEKFVREVAIPSESSVLSGNSGDFVAHEWLKAVETAKQMEQKREDAYEVVEGQ